MQEKIRKIVNTIREDNELAPVDTLKLNDRLIDDLNLSSLDLATLTAMVEDEFGVDVFEDGIISTIGEVYEKLK